MTISTAPGIGTDGWTFGPVGAAVRHRIRTMAFKHGVTLTEDKSLLSSMFRATGTLRAVDAMRTEYRALADRFAVEDHIAFVDAMEKAEKRRAFWGRFIGRQVRRHDLTRDEIDRFAALMASAKIAASGEEVATDRLTLAVLRLRSAMRFDAGISHMQSVVGTVASIGMRYLQHDLRTGAIRLPDALREQVMALVPTIDTWEDGD